MKKILKDYKKICFILVLFIVFAFALISCESSDTKTKGFVAGFVLDNTTGEPLSGVYVYVGQKDATTDEKGAYIIENILTGEYVALYKKDGYRSESGTVKADPYTDNAPLISTGSSSSGGAVRMTPLAGIVKGTIRVVIGGKEAPISSKLKIWVKSDSSNINYGPVNVGTDGTFTISGLPVGQQDSYLEIEPFIENGYSYTKFYNFNSSRDYDNYDIQVIKGTIDVGILFIKPSVVYDRALITAISVSKDSPLDPVDGSISITFNKPIDQSSFRVYGYSNNVFTGSLYNEIDLIAKWDSETKATLTLPAGISFKYNLKGSNLNYSDEAEAIYISDNSRAKDGSEIYVSSGNKQIPIYTVDSIKLLDVTTDTGALPTRSISNSIAPSKSFISNATTSIKLTFNKEIDEVKSIFYWNDGNNILADFRFGVTGTTTNKKVVYVSTATLVQNGTLPTTLNYKAISAKDESDILSGNVPNIQKGVEPTPVTYMALAGTDLYPGKTDTMVISGGVGSYFSNNDLSRDTTGDLTLTFNYTIPTDVTMDVHVIANGYGATTPLKTTWTTSGKDLKITPVGTETGGRLSRGQYYITVTIWSGNDQTDSNRIIFNTNSNYLTSNSNYIYYFSGSGIVFKTKDN